MKNKILLDIGGSFDKCVFKIAANVMVISHFDCATLTTLECLFEVQIV